jgi:hypothetical protein
MATRRIFPGLSTDDELPHGHVLVQGIEWTMTPQTWWFLDEQDAMGEVQLMMEVEGAGLHRLPDSLQPPPDMEQPSLALDDDDDF